MPISLFTPFLLHVKKTHKITDLIINSHHKLSSPCTLLVEPCYCISIPWLLWPRRWLQIRKMTMFLSWLSLQSLIPTDTSGCVCVSVGCDDSCLILGTCRTGAVPSWWNPVLAEEQFSHPCLEPAQASSVGSRDKGCIVKGSRNIKLVRSVEIFRINSNCKTES